jgi:sulfate adenylyltransferase subunit 1
VWFDEKPLDRARAYLLKHTSQTVGARVTAIRHRVNVQTLEQEAVNRLAMNDIGMVEIETLRPIFFDPYEQNRTTGSFILIDADTNATAAAGMIQAPTAGSEGDSEDRSGAAFHPAVLLLADRALAAALEDRLISAGAPVVRTRVRDPHLWRSLERLGVFTLVEVPVDAPARSAQVLAQLAVFSVGAADPRLEPLLSGAPGEPGQTLSALESALRHKGILPVEKSPEQEREAQP